MNEIELYGAQLKSRVKKQLNSMRLQGDCRVESCKDFLQMTPIKLTARINILTSIILRQKFKIFLVSKIQSMGFEEPKKLFRWTRNREAIILQFTPL
jgi:hypothetical protein